MNNALSTQSPLSTAIPAVGDFIEAGYFAGVIQIDGRRFGVVVAPKAQGETKSTWGKYGEFLDSASHVADGPANTAAMADADSPAAKWVQNLDINDHKDWYVPSRDEIELIYRHLKPGTGENRCSFRDGDNPSSLPPGLPYTERDPMQTSVEIFRAGGAEAFEEAWYMTSSQSSAYIAFVQDFSDGSQSYDFKDNEWRVRAVRRFIIN
jgi:hypothetical protein